MHTRQGAAVPAQPKNTPPTPVFCLAEMIALMLRVSGGQPGFTPAQILAGQQFAAKQVVLDSPMQGNGCFDEEAL